MTYIDFNPEEREAIRMPFGKYGPKNFPPHGVDICFINSSYLKWLIEQDWFIQKDNRLLLAVEKELEWRDNTSSHFYEDKVTKRR